MPRFGTCDPHWHRSPENCKQNTSLSIKTRRVKTIQITPSQKQAQSHSFEVGTCGQCRNSPRASTQRRCLCLLVLHLQPSLPPFIPRPGHRPIFGIHNCTKSKWPGNEPIVDPRRPFPTPDAPERVALSLRPVVRRTKMQIRASRVEFCPPFAHRRQACVE